MSIYWLDVKPVRPFIYFLYSCRRRFVVQIRIVENQNDSKYQFRRFIELQFKSLSKLYYFKNKWYIYICTYINATSHMILKNLECSFECLTKSYLFVSRSVWLCDKSPFVEKFYMVIYHAIKIKTIEYHIIIHHLKRINLLSLICWTELYM